MHILDNAVTQAVRKTAAFNTYLAGKSLSDGLVPWVQSLSAINEDISVGVREALLGKRKAGEVARELGGRLRSGMRYKGLVNGYGRELFGSATFPGEEVIAEGELLQLVHLPASKGVKGPGFAMFHVGGFLPYSDGIFRFLPEANLFDPYLQRGVPIYAMQLRGGHSHRQLREVTMPWLIDEIDRFSDIAFAHQKRKGRMVIEGYCGLGVQMLAYLAAKPQQAQAKFSTAVTMVAPVDGRACTMLSEFVRMVPDPLRASHKRIVDGMGYVLGDHLRVGMDIPLGTAFSKSSIGRFASGWKNASFSSVRGVEALDPAQRRELAGAYWISPANSRRFPLPAEVAQASTHLFAEGFRDDLLMPIVYGGKQLSLRTVIDETDLQLVGFYGGRDPVVPPSTADVLVRTMGDRYTRVVHPKAGHISYVLSPEAWDPGHRAAFVPDPITAISEARKKTNKRGAN